MKHHFQRSGIKLEINYTKKMEKFNMWRLNNMLLDLNGSKKKLKKLKKNIEIEWKCNIPKFMGCSENTSGREVHSDKCLSQEIRKVSNNLNLYLKELEK